jgi:hypothetical protein
VRFGKIMRRLPASLARSSARHSSDIKSERSEVCFYKQKQTKGHYSTLVQRMHKAWPQTSVASVNATIGLSARGISIVHYRSRPWFAISENLSSRRMEDSAMIEQVR